MTCVEQTLAFECRGDMLTGILTHPAEATNVNGSRQEIGMVVVVGGPQYRIGSHRQFLLLARSLAATGIAVLRFDVRGMGDSTGAPQPFDQIAPDIAAAIDALQQHAPQVRRVALWGLCDGASAALLYCQESGDPRVAGLCLLNPWVRSEVSLARAHVKYYYFQRLQQREFWAKLLSGQVAWAALTSLARNIHHAFSPRKPPATQSSLPFQERMALAWQSFESPMLLMLSGNDLTAQEFLEYVSATPAWNGALRKAQLTRHDEPQADHTFSQRRFDPIVAACTRGLIDRMVQSANQVRAQ